MGPNFSAHLGTLDISNRLGCCITSRISTWLFLTPRVLVANLSFLPVLGFQHFLCYICKEYVEDLAKIPKSFLQVSFPRVSSSVPASGRPGETHLQFMRSVMA